MASYQLDLSDKTVIYFLDLAFTNLVTNYSYLPGVTNTATGVQIQEMAVGISHNANTLVKGIISIIPSPDIGK